MKILIKIILLILFATFAIGSFWAANLSEEEKTKILEGDKDGKDN